MANISTLTVSLVADTAKFSSGLRKARSNAERFSKVAGASFKALAVGVTALGGALTALTITSLKQVDAQTKVARRLGLTQKALAGLTLAAEQTGNTQRNLELALQRSTRRIAEAATGTGEAVKALDELGLSATALVKLTPDQQFLALADAFEKVEGQSNKVRLGFKLFDSEGVALINTLKLGREELEAFQAEAEALGLTLTDTQTKAIEDANDAVGKFKSSLTGLGNQLAARFAPLITAGADALTGFVKQVTALVPKLFAFTSGLFGIRRELSELALVDVAAEIEVVDKEILDLQGQIKNFQRIIAQNPEGTLGSQFAVEELQKQLVIAEQRYNDLIARGRELKKVASETVIGGDGDGVDVAAGEKLELIDVKAIQRLRMEVTPELEAFRERVKKATAEAARIFDATRTPIQQFVIDMQNAREAVKLGGLSTDDFEIFRQQLLDELVGTADDFEDLADDFDVFAERAAENMQDAFADFFFDPFDDGLKGMVQGFADALRRMLANLIASDILNFLNPQGGGGFFGFVRSIFGRQIGGPVQRGVPVRVGESGPEIFTPGSSGMVRPAGNINFSPTTIIQGGSGLDTNKLIPILEENNRKVKGEFVDELRRGKFA
jgi:hypothetical protein